MIRPRSTPISRTSTFLAGPRPHLFAHRGLALNAAENTLDAFAAALAAGATHLETDVRVSADGIAVLSHDADLSRLTGRPERISELTAAELARLDLGHGQGYATLAECLDAFPEARFNLDLKSAAATAPLLRAVKDAGATGRILLASFDERTRSRAAAALPGAVSSASRRQLLGALPAAKAGLVGIARRRLAGLVAVQTPLRYGRTLLVTRRMVQTVQAAGVEVHVWTINDPAVMSSLLSIGVDGLITDRADLGRSVIDRHS